MKPKRKPIKNFCAVLHCPKCDRLTQHTVNGIGMRICDKCRCDNTTPSDVKPRKPITDEDLALELFWLEGSHSWGNKRTAKKCWDSRWATTGKDSCMKRWLAVARRARKLLK